jgi:hypothetical protein
MPLKIGQMSRYDRPVIEGKGRDEQETAPCRRKVGDQI